MSTEQQDFERELRALMRKHRVVQLSYTIDDDGVYAHREEGLGSWRLGFFCSED